MLCSPCLTQAVLFLQPGPCLHPSLRFGLFVWSAQLSQRISPWHNMLHVLHFNWCGVGALHRALCRPPRASPSRPSASNLHLDRPTDSFQPRMLLRQIDRLRQGLGGGSHAMAGCWVWGLRTLVGTHVFLHTSCASLCSSLAMFSCRSLMGKGDFYSCKAPLL